MITPSRVEEIRRLLNGGKLSQRAIARQTGVSRGTVQAVAEERRCPGSKRRVIGPRDGFTPPSGLPVRCPGCGAKVQMPCLACYVRKTQKSAEHLHNERGEESETSGRQRRSFADQRRPSVDGARSVAVGTALLRTTLPHPSC
jgi:hypothetical protein